MLVAIQDKGKVVQMKVGEVDNFQQNLDGSLDLVVSIWPQTPSKLKEQIEKNPAMMGMTAETLPINDALVFEDGTEFEEVNDTEFEDLKKRVHEIEGILKSKGIIA